MARSILGLLIIGAIVALVGNILSNLMRVAELRSVKRQIRRYERAFCISIKAQRQTLKKLDEITKKVEDKTLYTFPDTELIVTDETKKDDLPKFGDE